MTTHITQLYCLYETAAEEDGVSMEEDGEVEGIMEACVFTKEQAHLEVQELMEEL